MDCPTCDAMVDAYVDGELPATDSAAFELALEACPDCRRRLEAARTMSGLLRELPAAPAPDLLRARIERELRTISLKAAPRLPREPIRWTAMAASLIVAVGIGWLGAGSLRPRSARDGRADLGLSTGRQQRARGRRGLDRPPHGEAVVRRPHRLFATCLRPHRRWFPAGGRPARCRRRPQGVGPGLSSQSASRGADPVASVVDWQRACQCHATRRLCACRMASCRI